MTTPQQTVPRFYLLDIEFTGPPFLDRGMYAPMHERSPGHRKILGCVETLPPQAKALTFTVTESYETLGGPSVTTTVHKYVLDYDAVLNDPERMKEALDLAHNFGLMCLFMAKYPECKPALAMDGTEDWF